MYITSLIPERNAQRVKQYRVPFQGTWKTLPAHILPDDVLFASNNVVIRNGALRSRPGLRPQSDTTLIGEPVGSFMYISGTNIKRPIVATTSRLYYYDGVTWLDITGSNVSFSNRDFPIRFTSLESGNIVYLIGCNGINTPFRYSIQHSTAPITATVGSIPTFKDIATAAGRIVGFVPPYTVAWSNFLDHTAYPAANEAKLVDTEDPIVAIRSLGILGLVVYKEGSIYLGSQQVGSDATAFRFDYFGEYEGPAGVNAICRANGAHYYITPTGRIGAFDGANQQWVADSLWPFLRNDVDTTYMHRAHCAYDYRNHEVYFFYPRLGDSGQCRGIVGLNLPYPTAGIQTYAAFLGNTIFDISNSLGVRLFANSASPLLFTTTNSSNVQVFNLDGSYYLDSNLPFNCSFQPGLFQAPEAFIMKPFMELYAIRNSNKRQITISQVTSNLLETIGGTIHGGLDLDISYSKPNEFIGFTESASYLGYKIDWRSDSQFEYYGADVFARVIQQ